ncbi:MAG: histidine phosphatase family protein [Cyanobacteria bacterium]|nr:histidine phosphatase family protein [Cyanobacteria bacterium CG_2015-16_32_12]NCO78599.1 histidine phosphatase family protein [Cyanobacteria bacterium CG_2015-22_32_23]NCQ02991.1 histidine phosphatase family protein [Cyanobacteria bacterium CG_2015-09_32_10]NCQ40396.1 histidine phosphatase family protein [Cyanobacteria bacterium CG_2015-04_32_10]NCS83682.1 histidine phosphatase family protein [Cyanobacteria bacterium CG_2015-02_32_10]
MTTRVIIVRHGQSSYNAQRMIQGRCNESIITEKGEKQANLLGKALSNLKIDGFYCSPLQRAHKTAQIIQELNQHNPTLIITEKLREINLSLWEKWKKEDVKREYPQQYKQWKEKPHELKMMVDGEEFYPVLDLYRQAQEFWQEIIPQHQNETIVITAHNGINRCLLLTALGMEASHYHSIQQSNCCINVLNFSGNYGQPVQLESLNQTSHLGMPLPDYRPEQQQGLRLLLVRHGETEWNRMSRFQGVKDIPLNDNGRQQAQKAADFLKDIPLDFAVTSPLLRPKETAEIILTNHPNINLTTKKDLEEISHGLWEGKLEKEIEAEYPGLLNQWKEKPETVQMPEGENLDDVWQRAINSWQEIVKENLEDGKMKTGLVTAHDAINKVIICYLLGLKPANFWNIKQGNGAVTVIDYHNGLDGMPILQAINLTSHLSGGVFDQTATGAL